MIISEVVDVLIRVINAREDKQLQATIYFIFIQKIIKFKSSFCCKKMLFKTSIVILDQTKQKIVNFVLIVLTGLNIQIF